MICDQSSTLAVDFINGFGLKRDALASSVAYGSHNIVAVGGDRKSLSAAVNALIDCQGDVAVVDGDSISLLPLPMAEIMSVDGGDPGSIHLY
ncbi:adenine deaminase C-terminal domain-containing protein [Candidatus Vondammii sp. HM_W22]|uniref:adenine deaminase C-terminal domain-containing protein n=1 Tax=Candidatus Vondammii sp. HM_W22 TaxID=2687299 RepID=UPI00240284A3|nr:adenine deaminase C-terminal domain-containing protein [Candidatus Vondammii sp. HM_W22]